MKNVCLIASLVMLSLIKGNSQSITMSRIHNIDYEYIPRKGYVIRNDTDLILFNCDSMYVIKHLLKQVNELRTSNSKLKTSIEAAVQYTNGLGAKSKVGEDWEVYQCFLKSLGYERVLHKVKKTNIQCLE